MPLGETEAMLAYQEALKLGKAGMNITEPRYSCNWVTSMKKGDKKCHDLF
jgi:hypothetical protein